MHKSFKELLVDCAYMVGAGFSLALGAYLFFLVLRFVGGLV